MGDVGYYTGEMVVSTHNSIKGSYCILIDECCPK